MKSRARALIRRGAELHSAEYNYESLIYALGQLFTRMGTSEFAAKIDRDVLTTLVDALEREIRPQIPVVRDEYVRLCGFAWGDWVRIQNPGVAAVELVPTEIHYRPWKDDPSAWLHGRALKANGRPGNKGVQLRLTEGSSKVTVLSAVAERGPKKR
jgi:hypothetical protein